MSIVRCAAMVAGLALTACASDVLPSTDKQAAGPFPTYEIAETAYRLIHPGETTTEKLREYGIDPASTPNLQVLNYVEIMRFFMPTQSITVKDLDPAVQACIGMKTACTAYLLTPGQTGTQRTGHVSLDILGFRHQTHQTGWSASILILIVDDVVVYKLWSGTPKIDETTRENNPLGPAQDLSGVARGAIPKP